MSEFSTHFLCCAKKIKKTKNFPQLALDSYSIRKKRLFKCYNLATNNGIDFYEAKRETVNFSKIQHKDYPNLPKKLDGYVL